MAVVQHTNDPRLDTLVGSMVDRIRPELILLFGSRARGDAHEDSDYDLMIVVHDGEDPESCRDTANDVCARLNLSVDIATRTIDQYTRRQHDPGFLDWLVAREGRVLYSTGLVPQQSPRSDRVREQPTEGVDLWVGRARDDLRAARNNVDSEDPSWAAICFHAHACVEKLLKAVVVSQGRFPPRTHNLAALLAIVQPELRDDPELITACGVLQSVYPKSRYEPLPLPTSEEARAAFDAANVAWRALLRKE
jgi:HEPN domain-containing protein/predicted nucleotidyltransferase